jgi:Na+/alanine symporter
MFWIVIGILVYIAITFFFNILANNLESTEFKKVYYYSYVGDIIKNLLFTFSVIVVLKHVKKVAKTQDKTVPFLDMT